MFPFRVFTGAIFTEEQKDSSTELAFKYAVYRINKDKTVLPKTTLVYDIQYVPKDDSFRTAKIGKYLSLLLVVLFSRLIDQPIGSVHMEWIWKANTVEYLRSDKEPSRELELRDFEYNDRSQLILLPLLSLPPTGIRSTGDFRAVRSTARRTHPVDLRSSRYSPY